MADRIYINLLYTYQETNKVTTEVAKNLQARANRVQPDILYSQIKLASQLNSVDTYYLLIPNDLISIRRIHFITTINRTQGKWLRHSTSLQQMVSSQHVHTITQLTSINCHSALNFIKTGLTTFIQPLN